MLHLLKSSLSWNYISTLHIFMIFKRTVSSLIHVTFILMWGRNLTFPYQFVSSPNDWFWKQFPLLFWLATCFISRITIFILIYLWTLLFSFMDLWMASGTGTKLFPLLYLGGTFMYLGKHVSPSLLFHKFSELFSLLYSSRWTWESFWQFKTKKNKKKKRWNFYWDCALN